MLFNSLDFAVFLPLVFVLYWFVCKSIKNQNVLIVIASYFFYGYWDWRFLSLILFSTVVDFLIGININKPNVNRKALLFISIFVNLGLLGFFKYCNFFIDSFNEAFSFFGNSLSIRGLNIVLPVGISFYTFQTLSYTIDIYRRKLEPTKDFVAFTAFVSFFPQLVAGPIERATNLLPQFFKEREFDYEKAKDGLRQILWGLFKKVVIADNCAQVVNSIFDNYSTSSGSTLFIGAILFSIQIYGDFSGYSDIAIGTARLFGFNLKQNFAFPLFSRDIAEFWRRWHISLSTWFRDYLYIPLGGSKGGKWMKIRNTAAIFIVSGFWHGANWTFIVWGTLHAIFFLPLLLTSNNRKNLDVVAHNRKLPNLREIYSIFVTNILVAFALVIFRSKDISHALGYFSHMFSKSIFTVPEVEDTLQVIATFGLITFFMIVEWIGRRQQYGIENIVKVDSTIIRWLFYYILIVILIVFKGNVQNFIYFQF